MGYVEISNIEDRIIKFGLSEVERYKTGGDTDDDPWWNVHVIVKKPGIDYDVVGESMTQMELLELAEMINKTKNHDIHTDEKMDFMEPDYSFILSAWRGILKINISYTDSLNIWLTRDNLDDIASYIINTLKNNSI